MTGWKRYLTAVAAGLAGAAAWGGLMRVMGSSGYGTIGAMIIMLAALMWAREK